MLLLTQLTAMISVLTIAFVLGSNSLNTMVEIQANPCKYCSEDCRIYWNETHLRLQCKESQSVCGCAYPVTSVNVIGEELEDYAPGRSVRQNGLSDGPSYPSPKKLLLFLFIPPAIFLGVVSFFWCYRHGICCNKIRNDEMRPFPTSVIVRHPTQENLSARDQVFRTQLSNWNCSHVHHFHTNPSSALHSQTGEHVPPAPMYWDPPPPYTSIVKNVSN